MKKLLVLFSKIMRIFSIFSVIIVVVTIFILTYWLLYPYKILTFNEGNGTIANENKQVKSGEYLESVQKACKHIKLPATITRQLIDDIVYTLPPATINRPLGCSDNIEYIYISKGIPPGKFKHMITTITYYPNPFRTITYTITTEGFEVVE